MGVRKRRRRRRDGGIKAVLEMEMCRGDGGGGGGGGPRGREEGVTGAPSESRSMSRGSRCSDSRQPLKRQNSHPCVPPPVSESVSFLTSSDC